MANTNKLTFLTLLWISIACTICQGQGKTTSPKENATTSTGQAKLIKAGKGISSGSLLDKKGNLWFGSWGDGVYRYDGTSFANFTTEDGLERNMVSAIAEDRKGNIWLGTNSGVSYYDGNTFTYIPLSPPINDFVTCILEDIRGTLWIGTNIGVFCYDGKTMTRFLDNKSVINSHGLKLQAVQCMLEDKQGNIWFTTKEEGICRYDGHSIVNYTPNGITWFRGLLEDKDGNIWAGGKNSGVFRYDGKTFTNTLQHGEFDSYTVLSIIQDKTGNLWLAGGPSKPETAGAIWCYDGKTFKKFSNKAGLNHDGVWSLLEDKAGNIWIAARSGLSRFDGKTFTSFSE